jgi:hypothetical protein
MFPLLLHGVLTTTFELNQRNALELIASRSVLRINHLLPYLHAVDICGLRLTSKLLSKKYNRITLEHQFKFEKLFIMKKLNQTLWTKKFLPLNHLNFDFKFEMPEHFRDQKNKGREVILSFHENNENAFFFNWRDFDDDQFLGFFAPFEKFSSKTISFHIMSSRQEVVIFRDGKFYWAFGCQRIYQ